MPEYFRLEQTDGIGTLTFEHPERRNALSRETVGALENVLQEVRDNADMRVLILTGTGRAFSAGADIRHLKGVTDPEERQRRMVAARKGSTRHLYRVAQVLERLEQVCIAAINGFAVGGGWGLALACDFRIAAEGAQFWFPEVDLGVPLALPFTARLVQLVGPTTAKRLIMTCDRYSASDLLALRLVDQVVPSEQLMPAAQTLARQLADKPGAALAATKISIDRLAAGHEPTVLSPENLLF
jgi:enoyl-CoA hydratase/carnithine racemase